MKLATIVLLLTTLALPTMACGSPAAETQSAVEPATDPSSDPADLLRNGRAPVKGVLTGGQPTAEQFETLANLGYTTVINLRGLDENGNTNPEFVESLGMTYVSIPITGAPDVSEANARKLAEVMAASEGDVVIHCASGNRVGALVALKGYYVDGLSPEDALKLGKAAGVTRLEPVVRQQLGLE